MASTATASPPRDQPTEVRGTLPSPYLLFLGDTVEPGYAKSAFGLRDWAADRCVGEYALATARVSTGLPCLTAGEAAARGARALVIGVASPGGSYETLGAGDLVDIDPLFDFASFERTGFFFANR